jgi:MFS-type transporter involved in bile tolerance (Atg22 family)
MLCYEIPKVKLFVKSRTKIQDSRPDPVLLISWALFDFANSSYSTVIAAVIFPVYYVNVIVGNETGLGDLWWGRAISLTHLLQLIFKSTSKSICYGHKNQAWHYVLASVTTGGGAIPTAFSIFPLTP